MRCVNLFVWVVQIQKKNYVSEWYKQGVVGFGYPKIGDLTQKTLKKDIDKVIIQRELEESYIFQIRKLHLE